MTTNRAPEVHIYARQFHTRYTVPRAHPAPDQLRLQLDQVASTSLKHAIVVSLAEYLDPNSDAVWFIRHLELDVSVNASWDTDRLARVWATQVARALANCLESSGYDSNVVRFENPSAYVCQFLTDVVEDCAWSRWYYQPFSGLKMLTPTAAIRTVVTENPLRGVDALAKLGHEKRSQVVATLSTQDAQRILQVIPFAEGRVNMRMLLEAAWRAFESYPAAWDHGDEQKVALAICLEVAARERATLDRSLSVAAIAIGRLMQIAQRRPVLISSIKRILQAGNSAALYVVVSTADAAALAPLIEGHEDWIEDVCSSIVAQVSAGVTVETRDVTVARHTTFGGAFLLLPMLDALPIAACVRNWTGIAETSAESLVRFLVLAKALGGSSLTRLANDGVVRDAIGLGPKLGLSDILAWYASVSRDQHTGLVNAIANWLRERNVRRPSTAEYMAFSPATNERTSARRSFGLAAYALLAEFSKKLPGFSQSSFAHLRANFLDCSATVEEEPARYIVRISRPPLSLILNMTGMSRANYRVSWLTKDVAVFSDGAV